MVINNYTLYLTNSCMLNCPYCYEKRQRERHGIYKMPWEDIKSIIDFAKKNKKNNEIIEFSLFGGEPLFYLEDQVFKIIDYLKLQFNKDDYKITVMSNGFNLTKQLIDKLNGLNWFILISFDGPYYLISDNIPKIAYEKIRNNILNVPLEIRKKHIGLKATMSDSTIKYINEIYEYLTSLQTAIVYLSPTHEIDHFRIKEAIDSFSKDYILSMRDGKMLTNQIQLNEGLELYFKKGDILLLSHTFRPPDNRPVGWFKNGKISLSNYLIQQMLIDYPELNNKKMYIYPIDKEKCKECFLFNKYCIPREKDLNKNHLYFTQCKWYYNLGEKIKNGISKTT